MSVTAFYDHVSNWSAAHASRTIDVSVPRVIRAIGSIVLFSTRCFLFDRSVLGSQVKIYREALSILSIYLADRRLENRLIGR